MNFQMIDIWVVRGKKGSRMNPIQDVQGYGWSNIEGENFRHVTLRCHNMDF